MENVSTQETVVSGNTEQNDLLYDLYPENILEEASLGKRFANYLIDVVGYYIFMLFVGLFLGIMQMTETLAIIDEWSNSLLANYLLTAVLYTSYMTLSEGLTKGRSLGKLITGTRAVYEDGTAINFGTAFMRSLCRVVPFEVLSAFGTRPWHDSWTKTYVVKKQD